ncbi:DUF3558 family protein [Crossiella sp. SN42]|uniref:DUF3558 family protein n=1 Tax=Crossiella sp. SN42 TaxID=2944808 RepID=UPI00207CA38B|nr:DUF3558 family protein [Crossiella sp. SN42]MCO1581777.1 DUF3558 family protein [Crossiella sp. SN42]
MKKLLPLLAALAVLTACTQSIPGTPTPAGGPSAADAGVTPPSGEKVKRQPIRLGLQDPPKDWQAAGAPFDPCTVLGWNDIPEPQRDPKARPPKLMVLKKDDAIETGCMFYNDETISVVIPSPGAPTTAAPITKSPYFRVSVVWGATIDPAKFGGEKTTLGGKPAAVVPDTIGSLKDPICLVAMKFAKGGGGVDVRNGRFPGLDPCPIAKALAEKLAAKVP